MFYIFSEGFYLVSGEKSGNYFFMAHCRNPEVAHGFRVAGYVVSRCFDITKPIQSLSIRLVK